MQTILLSIFAIILLFLVSLSALFSFSEMAISSSNKTRLLTIVESGNSSNRKKAKAKRVIHFMDNYNEHITAIVIFNNIVNILFSTMATVFFTIIASNFLSSASYGALLSFVITTPIVIIFGEIIPKQLAKKYPESGTMALSTTIATVNFSMKPITFVLGKIIKEEETVAFNSDEEINTALSQATEAGVTTEYEQTMISKLLSADEKDVGSIMINIENSIVINGSLTTTKVNTLLRNSSHTRFPIVDKDGNVTSIFSTKKYLLDKLRDKVSDLNEYTYTFTTFGLDENPFHILESLRSRREKMAIIVDDDEKFMGIVTIEDILELLVGEIYDESDYEEDGVYALDKKSFILNNNVKMGYWSKEYVPEIKFTTGVSKLTVEKWVKELRGANPKHGDSTTYKNMIIWTRDDKLNKNKFVYEIDIID